jgi:hypothetical protein
MVTERRASERERVRQVRRLTIALALAAALAGCRQTVILDPSADGGQPTGAAGTGGPVTDAGPDLRGPGGFRFDAGAFDALANICPNGPIQLLQVVPRTPDVIVSVDRSVWMQSWWGAETRLEAIQEQVRSLVQQYERAVHFGYQEFPSTSSACGGGQGCCAGAVTPPGQRNRNAINNVLQACDNGGQGCAQPQRPAADALAKVNKTFTSFSATNTGRNRYVVLVLGGDPTCGEMGGEPGASSCDQTKTEVQKLNLAGIYTTVIGVGQEATTAACLGELALAGGLLNSVILAPTPSSLSTSLAGTVATMAEEACQLDVLTPPADTRSVNLIFDNEIVPNDPSNGWEFDKNTSLKITVRGTWCTTLLRTSRVDLVSGCLPQRHN